MAARNMLGAGAEFDEPHWFWSDQYDHTLRSYGGVGETDLDGTVIRGRPDEASFVRFGLRDGQVVSVLGLDRGPEVMAGRRLVLSGHPVAVDQLRDESVDLRRLVRRPARA